MVVRSRTPPHERRWVGVVALLLVALYTWWATSVAPFTAVSYIAVSVPVLALVITYGAIGGLSFGVGGVGASTYYRERAGSPSVRGVLPWVAILVAALALEGAGLALGGRSRSVPTLSTTIDHVLVWHGGRVVLFVVWLAAGWVPVYRFARRHQDRTG